MSTEPLILPWPATRATAASRMLWMADGFAEGASVLCAAMASDDYYPQYTNTRVILHLCRHATELFFKGAIAIKSNKFLKTHRIDTLYTQYKIHYPLDQYQIKIPFPQIILNPNASLFPDLLDDYIRTHDQRFRYPIDNQEIPFYDIEIFDVLEYKTVIEQFHTELNLLVFSIDTGRPIQK